MSPTPVDVDSVAPHSNVAPTVTSPGSTKSFFSKLTSRFRGRSKLPKEACPPLPLSQAPPTTITATLGLAPIMAAPPRSPSLRSPSPGSRVTFADAPAELAKVSNVTTDLAANSSLHPDSASPAQILSTSGSPEPILPDVVADAVDNDEDWVDAEDDDNSEPHKSLNPKSDGVHAGGPSDQVPTCPPGSTEIPQVNVDLRAFEQLVIDAHGPLVLDFPRDPGADARVTRWLAGTPAAGSPRESLDEEQWNELDRIRDEEWTDGTDPQAKRESKRPRPPQIIVPPLANNPYCVPLPPSPSNPPSGLSENSFASAVSVQLGLIVQAPNVDELVPPSPSILLTPAADIDVVNGTNDPLAVDCTLIPLPASPAPSSATLPECDELQPPSPLSDIPTVERASSMSTRGGRSLSTAPSTGGPATPTSMKFPGHSAFAHFTFGGSSPSVKIEDGEDGEEEPRGRSLEVAGDKRRMRSVSPKLDAVLEGDESRRSSRASIDGAEPSSGSGDEPPSSPLPMFEEDVKFGQPRNEENSGTEHEDECGFYAFAEKKMVADKKAAESQQLGIPKRSKTMSFLNVGFGKRKNTAPPSVSIPGDSSLVRSTESPTCLAYHREHAP